MIRACTTPSGRNPPEQGSATAMWSGLPARTLKPIRARKLSHRSVAGPRLSANPDLPVVAALPADPLRHAMSVGPVRDRCANVCGCAAPVWGHLAGFRHQGRHAGRLLASLSERQRAVLRLTRPITEAFSGRGCRAWIRHAHSNTKPTASAGTFRLKTGSIGTKVRTIPPQNPRRRAPSNPEPKRGASHLEKLPYRTVPTPFCRHFAAFGGV